MVRKLKPLKRLCHYCPYDFTETLIEIIEFKGCILDDYVSCKLIWMVNLLYENNYFSEKVIIDATLNAADELIIKFSDNSIFTIRKINNDIEFDGIVLEKQFNMRSVVDIMIPTKKKHVIKTDCGVTVTVPDVGMKIDSECLNLLRRRAEAGRQLIYSSQINSWNSATKPYK